MGHSHQHLSPAQTSAVTGRRAKVALIVFLVVAAVTTAIGMWRLWPDQHALEELRGGNNSTPIGVSYENATLTSIGECAPTPQPRANEFSCIAVRAKLLTGPEANGETSFEIIGPGALAGLQPGDEVVVMRLPSSSSVNYAYGGVRRNGIALAMTLMFVISVLAVARWRGFWALVGLFFSGAVVAAFTLPSLATGHSGIAVGLVGSVAIIFVVLYVAHGFSFRTTAALVGTILGLLISTGLGLIAVRLGRLSGYIDEAEAALVGRFPEMNLQELLVAAMIIAGLGVLNDVTITQTSAVWELRAAAPQMSRMDIFRSGMRIGRDHIASTIYTIVFAYTGAALSTLLLLILFNNRPVLDLLTTEVFGGELLRTLASATGLVLCVPITTALAALTVKPAKPVADPGSPTPNPQPQIPRRAVRALREDEEKPELA